MSSFIAEPLQALAVPVDNLINDPDNARRGNVAAVRRSLNVFGQRKPVVAKRTGTDADGRPTGLIEAGNTTFAAACELGWTHVAAIFVDEDSTTARAFALADNRTGELATWDDEQLAESLRELAGQDFDMASLGWTSDDIEHIIDIGAFEPDEAGEAARLDERKPTECPSCGYTWRIGPDGEVQQVE